MTTRRLAAILAADVVGFSSMMEKDEEGTLRRVKALQREVIEPKVKERGGRLVKTTGDGFLCEFGSPVEAVRCAVEVQDATKANGASDLLLRMGINLGDIIVEPDGDIYGEGVNVAARLEQLAEPGSIWLSEEIHRHVSGKIDRSFQERGEKQVKNIARPVRVYSLGGSPQARNEPKPLPLPDKPSIAVLPFTNMSADLEQDYFADGMVEDIITALSRVRWLFVIARNSSFTYKGRAVDVKQVGRDLGVRYVLEGSVRKAGGRIRITGQLIEAETGHHVWADNFDGKLEDVFELQDNITQSVVGAIEPRLREAEFRRSKSKPTSSLAAYDYYVHALHYRDEYTDEGNLEALRLLGEAVKCDPHYAVAYAVAAFCHAQRIYQGWSRDQRQEEARVCLAAKLALNQTEDDPEVLWRCGFSLAHAGAEIARCLALTKKAVGLNQNSAHGLHFGGWVQVYAGAYESAISRFARARRLSPFDPFVHGCASGTCAALLFLERFEEAVSWGHQAMAENPRFAGTHRVLAAALAHLGRRAEANEVIERLLSVAPNAAISTISKAYLQTPKLTVFVEGLRLAGLPE